MKKLLLTLILIFLTVSINAQENWESYIVEKDKGPMAISLNMKYDYARPNYKNLLITGRHTSKCYKNGYPNEEGLETLYVFSDSIANTIDEVTKNRLVGIITYQCSGFDIFYVKDTTNLRDKITDQIKTNFKKSKSYLQLEADKKWKYYHDSLFPKDLSEEFFINHDFLTGLVYNGDKLQQPRKITHWFYFRNEKKRKRFIGKIRALDFTVDSLNFKKKRDYNRYELQVSRKDSITPKSISKLTRALREFANILYAEYDGWSAPLITDDPEKNSN